MNTGVWTSSSISSTSPHVRQRLLVILSPFFPFFFFPEVKWVNWPPPAPPIDWLALNDHHHHHRHEGLCVHTHLRVLLRVYIKASLHVHVKRKSLEKLFVSLSLSLSLSFFSLFLSPLAFNYIRHFLHTLLYICRLHHKSKSIVPLPVFPCPLLLVIIIAIIFV